MSRKQIFHFKTKLKNYCNLIVLFAYHHIYASNESNTNFYVLLDEIYKKVQETDVEEINYETLSDELWTYYNNPLPLNEVAIEELRNLYILTDEQIMSLINHTQKYGPIYSLYELQIIPYFDAKTIYLLKHFIKIIPPPNFKEEGGIHSRLIHITSLIRYKKPLGEQKKEEFWGSQNEWVYKSTFKYKQFVQSGYVTRKKAGEKLIWNPKRGYYGFGHLAGYAQINPQNVIQKIHLGDYKLGFGQGLINSANWGFKNTEQVITSIIQKSNLGIVPYNSIQPNKYYRGIGMTVRLGAFELTPYYSYNMLDGKVNVSQENILYTTRILEDGNYRNEKETDKRRNIEMQTIGSSIVYQSDDKSFTAGIQALYYFFDVAIYPKKQIWNEYAFRNLYNYNESLFIHYVWQNMNLFGEVATSHHISKTIENIQTHHQGIGIILGNIMSLSKKLDLSLLGRYYGKEFHTYYGKPFGEHTQNERGIYTGLQYIPIWKKWFMKIYYDLYQFPEAIYRAYQASKKHDIGLRNYYEWNKTIGIGLVNIIKYKEVNPQKQKQKLNHLIWEKKYTHKGFLKYIIDKIWYGRIDIHFCHMHKETIMASYGIGKDLFYKAPPVKVGGGCIFFKSRFYETRLFFFTKEMLQDSGFKSYYGSGIHYFILTKYQFIRGCHLEVKYARTDAKKYIINIDQFILEEKNEKTNGSNNYFGFQMIIKIN